MQRLCSLKKANQTKKKKDENQSSNSIKCTEGKVGFQCKELLNYWANEGIKQNVNCHEETQSGRGIVAVNCQGRDADVSDFSLG